MPERTNLEIMSGSLGMACVTLGGFMVLGPGGGLLALGGAVLYLTCN